MEYSDNDKLESENFKDITMDNQQETKNYIYILFII